VTQTGSASRREKPCKIQLGMLSGPRDMQTFRPLDLVFDRLPVGKLHGQTSSQSSRRNRGQMKAVGGLWIYRQKRLFLFASEAMHVTAAFIIYLPVSEADTDQCLATLLCPGMCLQISRHHLCESL
jgi:hypothetical protein